MRSIELMRFCCGCYAYDPRTGTVWESCRAHDVGLCADESPCQIPPYEALPEREGGTETDPISLSVAVFAAGSLGFAVGLVVGLLA